ncbi:VanZ family protein [Dactylosporangium darangshiense]|uniref:VanZ-like domain-containing protein n=1 Tax=Dactylosporangium darangshiense TaxID=579108 RepID=A0ABP8D9P4_9ACTN|nr:VanZ family protein [Dactylosporangium sp.]
MAIDRRRLGLIGTVAGTAPWVVMILWPTSAPRRINLDPVRGLAGVLTSGPRDAIIQMGGNLAVFAAFGVFGPMRWRLGVWAVTGLAALGSAVLETLQYVLDLGRVTALDDVLVNAAGAGIAALLARRWRRPLRRPAPVPAPRTEPGTPSPSR